MNELKLLTKSKKSGVRTTQYQDITSFICQDNLYKTGRIPVMARGLFTNIDGKIVIRGYDKFFNIGEIQRTEWEYLENNTEGPYYIVSKENGCMIFISSDGNGDLYITSKHSFTSPHAEKARQWLDIHLTKSNKTRNELSLKLMELNSTAAFELCSDDFEEHVLPYNQDRWGLHCHGIIKNVELFDTFEPNFVQEFSRSFGFHEVSFVKRDTIQEVKKFCEEREGEPIEGWVIRSGNMFVKYKYEKPYLVWREWREITNSYLKNGLFHNFSWRYYETEQYSEWVKNEIMTNIQAFDGFLQNRGIIKIRNMYLDRGVSGNFTKRFSECRNPLISATKKILIIPVAVPGVGKSTICRILSKLMSATIIENDNLNKKNQDFTKCIVESLLYNSIVIADRNNHTINQRKQLVESCKSRFPDIKIWILEWIIPSVKDNNKMNEIKQILYERVENRGENHQTLTPKTKNYKEIIDSFLEKRTDVEYDFKTSHYENTNISLVRLQVRDSIATNIRIICDELEVFPQSGDDIQRFIDDSLYYTIPKSIINVRYWGFSVSKEQMVIINNLIQDNVDSSILKKMTKIPKENHITLAYSRKDLCEYWKSYEQQKWNLEVDSICYNNDIIAITLKNFDVKCENSISHITIAMTHGTFPYESNNMVSNTCNKIPIRVCIEAFGPIPYL